MITEDCSWDVFRNDLILQLKDNVCEVNFTKLNGEVRIMKCTLQDSYIPETTSETTKKPNTDILSVWDIEKGAWRSFRVDSLNSFEVLQEDI